MFSFRAWHSSGCEVRTAFRRCHRHISGQPRRHYTWAYDLGIALHPLWGPRLRKTVKHIKGARTLEVCFGTGYLLSQLRNNADNLPRDAGDVSAGRVTRARR
jgi:ubiquinone/menaquinone biosynthesis C-methylase UbiE